MIKVKPRKPKSVPIDELLVMCDYIEERGFCQREIGKPYCYLFAKYEQIVALRTRLPSELIPFRRFARCGYRWRWMEDVVVFNREDIKALLTALGCMPVSHYYRTVYV